jgi:hypothetical protein
MLWFIPRTIFRFTVYGGTMLGLIMGSAMVSQVARGRPSFDAIHHGYALKPGSEKDKARQKLAYRVETNRIAKTFEGGWRTLYVFGRNYAEKTSWSINDHGLKEFLKSMDRKQLPKLTGEQMVILSDLCPVGARASFFTQLAPYHVETKGGK